MAVDAPVSGGIAAANAGTLTFMVGGTEEAFGRAEPCLSDMGRAVIHAGASGAGQAAKICNNMILGATMIATCEALLLAEKLGLDPQTLLRHRFGQLGPELVDDEYAAAPRRRPRKPRRSRLSGWLRRRADAEGPEAGAGSGGEARRTCRWARARRNSTRRSSTATARASISRASSRLGSRIPPPACWGRGRRRKPSGWRVAAERRHPRRPPPAQRLVPPRDRLGEESNSSGPWRPCACPSSRPLPDRRAVAAQRSARLRRLPRPARASRHLDDAVTADARRHRDDPDRAGHLSRMHGPDRGQDHLQGGPARHRDLREPDLRGARRPSYCAAAELGGGRHRLPRLARARRQRRRHPHRDGRPHRHQPRCSSTARKAYWAAATRRCAASPSTTRPLRGLGQCDETPRIAAHSIYLRGWTARWSITHSRFERGTGGHYVKLRARRVTITGNSFDDSRGNKTNYMIDLSEGGTGLIARNTFVQGQGQGE